MATEEVIQQQRVSHADMSGMSVVGNKMLHDSQVQRAPQEHYKYMQSIGFDSPSFGKKNTVKLSAIDMVVSEAYVELILSAVTGPSAPSLPPTWTWLKDSGMDLTYNGTQLYNQSSTETFYGDRFLLSDDQRARKAVLTNDMPLAVRKVNAGVAHRYYISCKAMVDKILSKSGPLTAYAANKWGINVTLQDLNKLISGTTSTVGACSITEMNLILIGHKSTGEEASRVAQTLASGGIDIFFDDSTYFTDEYSASATSKKLTVSSLEGNSSDVFIIQRVKAGLTSTNPTIVDQVGWQLIEGASDTVNIGKTASPNLLFGQPLSVALAKYGLPLMGFQGGARQIYAGAGSVGSPTGTFAEALDIDMSMLAQLDQTVGSSSGYVYFRNNMVITLVFGSTTVTENQVDYIVFLKKKLNLTNAAADINNSD